jgi:hypothetical protein
VSPCLEENTILGLGGDDTDSLFGTVGYFNTLGTDSALGFDARYSAANGVEAPVLSAHAESCYEGLLLLRSLATRACSLEVAEVEKCADGTVFAGARGVRTVRSRHVDQPTYLGVADGLDFRVVAEF